jgi:hypothetical protein
LISIPPFLNFGPEYISTDDILRHLLKLKPSSASGDDALPGFILKDCAQILITPLHFLYNLILTTSVYACLWNVGKICPIFKSGKKNIISNNRPVTILPHISKVFESIIYSYICGGREKVGKSKMLIFQGNDSKFHIIPKIL